MNGPPPPAPHHQRRKPAQQNAVSSLLSDNEHNSLYALLGRKCATLATAVVQVYLAQGPGSQWQKRCTGVCCFVKDNPQRSYFIRVYCIREGKLIWEQEMYSQFKYNTPRPYFHTFDTDKCRAGLNFANEKEAFKFKQIVEEKVRQKQEKRSVAKFNRTSSSRSLNTPMSSTVPVSVNSGGSLRGSNSSRSSLKAVQNQPQPNFQQRNVPVAKHEIKPVPVVEDKKSKKKKGKKGKLTKADISMPSGFTHVGHVGWDPDKGFDANKMDPDVKELFSNAGITEKDIQDEETAQFIYDFIEKQGGIEAVKKDTETRRHRSDPPPPPPSRGGALPPTPPSRGAAPPPPGRGKTQTAPPPPHRHAAQQKVGRGNLPPPPPHSSRQPHSSPAQSSPSNAPPPPPPPPSAPAPPPAPPSALGGRGGMAAQLRDGSSGLKPASERSTPEPSGGGGRDALLDAIRKGTSLKTVSETAEKEPAATGGGEEGLAGALARALQKRENAIHTDSESDSANDEFDEEEWSD